MNDYDFKPGVYRVKIARLNVHATPETGDNNRVKVNGVNLQLTQGKEFPVYSRNVDATTGWSWGIITPAGAPQAHYVCLYDLNTLFADYVSPFAETSLLSGIYHIEFIDPTTVRLTPK